MSERKSEYGKNLEKPMVDASKPAATGAGMTKSGEKLPKSHPDDGGESVLGGQSRERGGR